METTLVSRGIFPPTINTTPNSPTVCANDSTIAVMRDVLIFGSKTLRSVVSLPFPKVYEASTNDEGSNFNPLWMGCTINGRLYRIDATMSPSKVKTNLRSKYCDKNSPKAFLG